MKCSFSSLSMMTGNKTGREQGEAEGRARRLPKMPFCSQRGFGSFGKYLTLGRRTETV
jgi:hypothetical protein